MQYCTRHYPLYFCIVLTLFLSTNLYFTFLFTKNQHKNFHFSINDTTNIADRIVLFVRTSQNCQSRLNYLLQSWISTDVLEQSNLYLITDRITNKTNLTLLNSFHHVIQTHCPETHSRMDLCCKTAHEFKLFYRLSKIKSNLEWLCRFDDDHYVNLNNLYKYLSQINASKPYYIGRTSINDRLKISSSNRTFTFATYGAGVCFSHALLQQLHPHVHIKILPRSCMKRGLSDDAYIGYLIEFILNVSLTVNNDLFHSHLEKLDKSFRNFSLDDLFHAITFGFAWDRYKLDWLPIIHQLINLINQGQYETANRLWLFLRNYEKEHPENLKDKYDESCTSYQRLRNQSIELQTNKNKKIIQHFKKHIRKR
ncbi:unnamed protein product [Rotaria sp. Silwood1]|nr:unnamed protein product [Rotaria sp. Silwood1]CAF3729476.1 unnamed protein product [Rotaria sp. Silwood1]CAF3819521.1 unnamed protein product [Rotaria sp. Silwood1]CAF4740437.1 unnamed protein product [Rotaria sp. Silwood1]CAF5045500.1 unnamed protein product [Rotaria sp. Silwood1]